MAKQTFTTGQVLLASQLTSLQQTAMNGGAFSAKTSSYTAVAADAGTAISMTSTSATTITINSGLFAAGDTILITNLGSGACVITAGTATVNTAGSLSLSQYEAGLLHFVSASSAVFNDYVQTASNPLTTTGDMIYSSSGSTQARLGIGSTGQVLTVASGLPSWATPASGSMTLISTTTLSGTSVTLSSIPATYKNLNIVITGITNNTGAQNIHINANASATLAYFASVDNNNGTVGTPVFTDAPIKTNRSMSNTLTTNIHNLTIQNYANATAHKSFDFNGGYAVTAAIYYSFNTAGSIKTTSAISSIQITSDNGYTFTAGTVLLYGVN